MVTEGREDEVEGRIENILGVSFSSDPPKVYVSSLSETSIFTAFQRFDFRDGDLGAVWLEKCGVPTICRPSVGKPTIVRA